MHFAGLAHTKLLKSLNLVHATFTHLKGEQADAVLPLKNRRYAARLSYELLQLVIHNS